MARPRLPIDEKQVLGLASIHCTYDEMAKILGCSTDTLSRRFADLIERGRANGKMSLRRVMHSKATLGNVQLLIWLSKQHLGMSDRTVVVNKLDADGQTVASFLHGKSKSKSKPGPRRPRKS
jgi:hypothetical protein